jgi:hypothetical protein
MSVATLNKITAACDFPPPQRLFSSRQQAHDELMAVVGECLREIQADPENYSYPSEDAFVEQMKMLWLEIWNRYCPRT